MADEEKNQAQQPAPVQIMQSVTITPMPEFSPDAKLGTSKRLDGTTGRPTLKCI